MERLHPFNPILKTITEQETEKMFKSNQINQYISWYKDLNGRYIMITPSTLDFFTAKNYSSINQVIGEHEYNLHKKIHRPKADLLLKNDQVTYEQGTWYGIEPCHYQDRLEFLFTCKKAVVNTKNKIIGSLGYVIQFIETENLKSLMEIAKLKNNSSIELLLPTLLTNREAECLFYTLRGKSAKAIALTLHLSPKTVEFHIKQLKNKFDCISKSQLIEKAIALGYFEKIPASFTKKPGVKY